MKAASSSPSQRSSTDPVTGLYLILQRDDALSLQTACGMLATATSMGRPASVFLTYGALWKVTKQLLDEDELQAEDPAAAKLLERARNTGSLASPSALLHAAREGDDLKLFACSASVRVLQLGPEELTRVDGILGLAAFLERAASGQLLVL